MSLWLVTAYFPAHIAAGNFAPKRIPPNNFDFDAWSRATPPLHSLWRQGASEEIDGIGAVGDHRANGFVECGFDFNTNYFSTEKSMGQTR